MALKRKLSEETVDKHGASKRQLRSGRTAPLSASPKKSKLTSVQSQRSPRKRGDNPPDPDTNLEGEDNTGTVAVSRGLPQKATKAARVHSPGNQALTNETNIMEISDMRDKKNDVDLERKPVQIGGLKGKEKETSKGPIPPKKILVDECSELATKRSNNTPSKMDNAPARRQLRHSTVVVEITSPSKKSKRSTVAAQVISTSTKPSPEDAHMPPTRFCTYPLSSNIDSSALPVHLHPGLTAQKREILRFLQCPTFAFREDDQGSSPRELALKQLDALVQGTVLRAEGNSCLLLGPRGGGKSRIIEDCLENLTVKPIILRLSGWVQSSDKIALREIAFQLLQQTGSSILSDEEHTLGTSMLEETDDENPFLDRLQEARESTGEQGTRLPPSSQLHALIPLLLTLSRPVVVILDAFDLFALHPRQSLLYCLLDTAQSCRASSENRGIAVIGMTSRVDTVQLLEKRVKSRFSGRIIRTAPPNSLQHWLGLVKAVLQAPITCDNQDWAEDWERRWTSSVNDFLSNADVLNEFNETFSITRDIKILQRLLTSAVLGLNPSDPYLSFKGISTSVESQRSRPRNLHFQNLSYPSMCLLIASVHANTAGHPIFTFEMLFDKFRDQVRASTAAPVQVNGGNIGMVRCTRDVLMTAFDGLRASKTFVSTLGPSNNIAKEFIKYRSVVDREAVKEIIEKSGQIHLKKWLHKG